MKASDRAKLNKRLAITAADAKGYIHIPQPKSSYGSIPMVNTKVAKKLGFMKTQRDRHNLAEETPSRCIRKRKTYKRYGKL